MPASLADAPLEARSQLAWRAPPPTFFVTVHSKGVTARDFGIAHSKGVRPAEVKVKLEEMDRRGTPSPRQFASLSKQRSCRRGSLELHEKKEDSRGQKGQSRKQKAEEEESERIEKVQAGGYRDARRGWSREFTTHATAIFNILSSHFIVLVFRNRGTDSKRICVRGRKQRGRVRSGLGPSSRLRRMRDFLARLYVNVARGL